MYVKREKRETPKQLRRDIATVRRLLNEKYRGDTLLCDVLDLLQEELKGRARGRPREWNNGAQFVIYAEIEALMARDVKINKTWACRTVAWWHGIGLNVIWQRHAQGEFEWGSLPEQERIKRMGIARDYVDRNFTEFGMVPKRGKPPPAKKRGFGLPQSNGWHEIITRSAKRRYDAQLLSVDACIATEDSDHLVLAVRLDKDRLRASPGAFVIGEHFTPSPGLLAAINHHLTPRPEPEESTIYRLPTRCAPLSRVS